MFCDGCAREWLALRSTCPTCSAPNDAQSLSRPPRMICNMVDEIELFCAYKERGCQAYSQLQHILHHETSCAYQPLEGHDDTSVGQLKDEITELRSQVHALSSSLASFFSQIEVATIAMSRESKIVVLQARKDEGDMVEIVDPSSPVRVDPTVHPDLCRQLGELNMMASKRNNNRRKWSLPDPFVQIVDEYVRGRKNRVVIGCMEATRKVASATAAFPLPRQQG